jgi:hypothetical protein
MFGELGGQWTFNDPSQGGGCTASFTDATVSLSCTGAGGRLNGKVDLTFTDDAHVSGTTSEGQELAGTKR